MKTNFCFSLLCLYMTLIIQPTHCYCYQLLPSTIRKISVWNDKYSNIVSINKRTNKAFNVKHDGLELKLKIDDKAEDNKKGDVVEEKEPSAFDQVASKGLAGVLAIAAAEA